MYNYISTEFKPDMFCADFALARFESVSPNDIPHNVVSTIKDSTMAQVVSGILGFEFKETAYTAYVDDKNTALYLASYNGPYPEKGSKKLPKGASITFYKVTARPYGCSGCENFRDGDCSTCNWMCQ